MYIVCVETVEINKIDVVLYMSKESKERHKYCNFYHCVEEWLERCHTENSKNIMALILNHLQLATKHIKRAHL